MPMQAYWTYGTALYNVYPNMCYFNCMELYYAVIGHFAFEYQISNAVDLAIFQSNRRINQNAITFANIDVNKPTNNNV